MRKSLRALGAAVAFATMITLAGCGDGAAEPADAEQATDQAQTDAPSEAAADLSPEAQAAADIVAAASTPVDEFTAPGPAVDGSVLEGKTVYYIPATLQVPLLNIVGEAVTGALGEVGAKVQVCDAKANPADAASCITQAIDAKAAVVVSTGMPKEFAPAAFDALLASGIPWVQAFTSVEGDEDPAQVAYVTSDNVLLQSWAANWVIADSDAQAKVLVIKLTDTPATTAWADFGILATYENGCPECDVEVIEINSGQTDRLPSLVSSALVANPDIAYVQSQFDQFLPSVTQAIQSAGRDDVKVVSVDGLLSTLQDLESGRNVAASVGFNQNAFAWYIADAAVRLADGEGAVVKLDFPFRRIFTEQNVGDLTLTPEAQATGEWFGKADYQAGFLKLWGIS
ncbi:sugar ABC transporter substrate-binding protein [Georgenia yuyongxinii]|nr:substrate-binding domain-containing protein [Georgenia yuyongxinii]